MRWHLQGSSGGAVNAGERWGVAIHRSSARPLRWWPRWEDARPEARAIAYRHTVGFVGSGGQQVADALARLCWERARIVYLDPPRQPGVLAPFQAGPTIGDWLRERDRR